MLYRNGNEQINLVLNKSVHFWKDPYSNFFVVASIYTDDEMKQFCTGKTRRYHFMFCVTLSLLTQSQEIFWQKPMYLCRKSFQKEGLYKILKDFLPRADNSCIYGYYCQESCFQIKIISTQGEGAELSPDGRKAVFSNKVQPVSVLVDWQPDRIGNLHGPNRDK